MVAVLHPLGPGRQIVLDRAVVLVGRSPDCDAVLDTSSRISRVHCALVQVDQAHFIRDLGSTNGVWVNGQRVERDCRLLNGVKLAIGDVQFQFFENVQPAGRQPAGQLTPDQARPAGPAPAVFIDETQQSAASGKIRPPRRSVEDDVILLPDSPGSDELIDDVEVIEDGVDPAAVHDDVNVDVVDEIEILDEVELLDDPPFRPRPRRPRR